ncbi:uncharacterized protein I206_102832 [Kwoniella pini CBS 10737]|uniref:Uncharacterized protein n=1 Tax=Kwoniella pini CBS 10737 TaxID=1296096 RepID=A0AAJ8MMG0_9TREE
MSDPSNKSTLSSCLTGKPSNAETDSSTRPFLESYRKSARVKPDLPSFGDMPAGEISKLSKATMEFVYSNPGSMGEGRKDGSTNKNI